MFGIKFLTAIFILLFFNSYLFSAEDNKKTWKPSSTNYDWVQLSSGEWLKGEIKILNVKHLIFDSTKLGLLKFNWDDVGYLQRHDENIVKIENHKSVIEILSIAEEKIKKAEYDKRYKRNTSILFTPVGDKSVDLWTVKFTFGMNVRSGNTKQVDLVSKLAAKHTTNNSKYAFDYIGNFAQTGVDAGKLEETSNSNRLNSVLDMYVSKYFFYNPLNAEYFRDPFQNISYRINLNAGLGYVIIDSSIMGWDISAGPAFVATQYKSVQAGEDDKVDSASFSINTKLDADLSETIYFIYKYNALFSKNESGGYSHHMIGTLESKISSDLNLDISLIWDRISHPTVSSSGRVPTPDDFRLIVGISYSF